MKNVRVVCEGPTEEQFIKKVVAPALALEEIYLIPILVETSPGQKGGAMSYDRVLPFLLNTLKQASQPVVTTFIDLYKLDTKFPGYKEAVAEKDLDRKMALLTEALAKDVVTAAGCDPDRFIPHIQPHEFEALLFSDVEAIAQTEDGWHQQHNRLSGIRAGSVSPEHINDQPNTKPAAHLERELKKPAYHKVRHGPLIAAKIGLEKMAAECAHFRNWLEKLRQ